MSRIDITVFVMDGHLLTPHESVHLGEVPVTLFEIKRVNHIQFLSLSLTAFLLNTSVIEWINKVLLSRSRINSTSLILTTNSL